jgi:hypothetical protein
MKKAADIFKDLPDGSSFVDGSAALAYSTERCVRCGDQLGRMSGNICRHCKADDDETWTQCEDRCIL